jgi:hypothetical protein
MRRTRVDWWSICTWIGILGGAVVLLGGVGSWYFGRLDSKETRATIHQLETSNAALTNARDALQKRADSAEAELRETQRKLDQKTAEVWGLAPRDVPKPVADVPRPVADLPRPVAPDVERATIRKLQATRASMPQVSINAANVGVRSIQDFFYSLLRILQAGGVQHAVKKVVGLLLSTEAPHEPYKIVARPGEEAVARRLAEALKPFIVSEPSIVTDSSVPAGTVVLTLEPQAVDVHKDGSVALR